jgi:hypothetical protein
MGKFDLKGPAGCTAFIKSIEVPVYWHGFRSTTLELQEYGWQFFVESEPHGFRYRIMMAHNDMKLYGFYDEWDYHPTWSEVGSDWSQIKPLVIRFIRPNVQVQYIDTTIQWSNANPVDMRPEFINRQRQSMEDLLPFNLLRPVQEITREVIIEKQADMSVVDHLQRILEQQEERQAEIRNRRLDNMRREKQESLEVSKPRQVRFQVVT